MKIRHLPLLCAALALALLPPSAARGQTSVSWQGDGSGNFSDGFWSNASLWNPATVPNNAGGSTYDVTITQDPAGAPFNGPALDVDVTVSNLTMVNRAYIQNQGAISGTNLTVTGTTTFTTTPGHTGETGAVFFSGGTFSMGTLSNYNASTHTLNDAFLFPLNGGTIQFRNADIVTNNATIIVGDGSNFLNQTNGQIAYKNLAVNNGGFNLGAGHNFTTVGDFTNNGGLAVGTSTNGMSSMFTVGGSLTNFDAATHTLAGGSYSVGTNGSTGSATLRFAGADVRTLSYASVTLDGAQARITDLNGNDAFRNLTSLAFSTFNSSGTTTYTPASGTLNLEGSNHTVTPGSAVTVQGNYHQDGGTTTVGNPAANPTANTSLTINGSVLVEQGGRMDFGGQPGVNTIYTTTLQVLNGIEFRGAFLTGTGTIIADTLVTTGSVLAPGHSPGALNFGGRLELMTGVQLQMQIGGLDAGTGYDLIAQTGPLALMLGGELHLTFIDGFEQSILGTDTFSIITSGNALTGTFDNVASGGRLASDDGFGSFLVTYAGQNEVVLSGFQASIVPEPGAWALLAVGFLGLAVVTRARAGRKSVPLACAALLAASAVGASAQYTTSTWDRKAFGQLHYVPGHENDPAYGFYYPNNNAWHQSDEFYLNAQGQPLYQTAPSNWSTPTYPNGAAYDVILGNASTGGPASTTNLDRYGPPISIHSLTILPEGALNIEAGITLTARQYDFRGDGTLTNNGGGGAFPVITVPAGGTMTKSGGAGTYQLDVQIVLNLAPTATAVCNSGTLQLPGGGGLYDGAVFTPAGGVIDLVSRALYNNPGVAKVQGKLTSGSTTGTVRLSDNVLAGNRDYSSNAPQTPVVLDFPGSLFQWTGGELGAYQGQNPFTNTGTMNITGSNGKELDAFLTNNGTVIQAGTGVLVVNGQINNNAGAVYELREGAAMDGYGPVTNAGLLTKTAGAGQSVLDLKSTFVNTGTVAVHVGTLAFPSITIPSGTLATGVWQVYAGAELDFKPGSAVAINQADVSLIGPNSNFPACNSLTDNQGRFALLAQREFTTAGALSNEGTITLDAGSTLHVPGPYTGGSASTLAFIIGGTQTQGAQSPGVLQSNGAVTLGGSLSIRFPAGASLPGSGDTVAILSSSTPVNGSFANVSNGARLDTADGLGSFQVNYGPGSTKGTTLVVLSNFVGGASSHPAFFAGETPLSDGVYYLRFANGNPFGYYSYLSDPHYIYHFDLGYEYLFDAADGKSGVYLYDFKGGTFFYSSPAFPFPYLYDFTLNTVLYYYPDPSNPGHYNTDGYRFFYRFDNGQIIVK